MKISQTIFSQRQIKELAGALHSGPHDYLDLYSQLGIASSRDTDVQAFVGVLFFAECARLGISLPTAKKLAFEVVPEGTIFLGADPSCWHFQGELDESSRFIARFSEKNDHNRKLAAQDLLNIPGHAFKRFLAQFSDGIVRTSNDARELFQDRAVGGAAVVDIHGLAMRLRNRHQAALFWAAP